MEEIEIAVSDYLEISILQIRSRNRKQEVVKARFICWYFIYKNLKWTAEKIGKEYGYNHGTILHAINKIDFHYGMYEDDKKIIRDIWTSLKYNTSTKIGESKYRELIKDTIKYNPKSFADMMTDYKTRSWIYRDLEIDYTTINKIEMEIEKKEKKKDEINKTKSNDIGGTKVEQLKKQTKDGKDILGVRE